MDLQASAPMSKTETASPRAQGRAAAQPAPQQAQVTPLFAPTQRPDEPITAGAPFGAGPGPAQSNMPRGQVSGRLAFLAQYDSSGDLSFMADVLASRGL